MIDYDQVAAAYARHRRIHPEVLKNLIETGGITRDSRVLEVGCGTGNYIAALAAGTGCSGCGIDPSAAMLERARAKSTAVDWRLATLDTSSLEPDTFDLVFSVDVIHHIERREAYFHDGFRLLKRGGRLCTVTDSEWIIRNRQPLAVYFPETVAAELARYPRVAALREMMQAAGFGDICEQMAEFAYQLTDLQVYRDRAFSALHVIGDDAVRRGLERMERDLLAGPILGVARYALLWGTR